MVELLLLDKLFKFPDFSLTFLFFLKLSDFSQTISPLFPLSLAFPWLSPDFSLISWTVATLLYLQSLPIFLKII